MVTINWNELNGREMQRTLELSGIRAQKVVKRRFTGHYTAEFYTPNLGSAVPAAREWSARIEEVLPVQIMEARDTRADWRPGKPIIAASVTFAVLEKAPAKPAASKAQQQAEATPHTPASVDGFLFGDVKRLQAHELHDADGAPVEDKDARIRQLEADNRLLRGANRVLIETLTNTEKEGKEQKALLSEAAQVIAPVAESTVWDDDVNKSSNTALLSVEIESGVFTYMRKEAGLLCVGHLRAIAEFAAKLDAALKK